LKGIFQQGILKWLIPAIAGFVLITALYLLMQNTMPKYAGRVPFLLLLFIFDWLILKNIVVLLKKCGSITRRLFIVLWWSPLAVLLLFLLGTSVFPLQSMDKFWRIYLPGIALMAYLAKIIMLIPLLPVFLLQIKTRVTGFFFGKTPATSGKSILFFRRMGIFIGSLAFAGLLIGSTIWVYKFKIHSVSLQIEELPDALEGLRIVQLSDLHLGSWMSAAPLQRAIDKVNALNPDIVVFTGDMVNYSSAEVKGFGHILAQVRAPLGVYAVLGNHDYGDYTSWKTPEDKEENMNDLIDFYKSIGWKLLRNSTEVISIDSARLLMAGVENWSATARFKRYGDMVKTMEGVTYGDFNILLSHDPTHWDAEVLENYRGFDLTLSGHTHGMQLGIEALGMKWSPARYMYKHWAGLTIQGNRNGRDNYLYVNRGLGHIAYPGRVGILPEITLITLARKD
jgi:predicted MPP superfamily phosphohydrolase